MDKPKAAASEAVEEVVETTKKVEKKIEKKLTYLWDEIDAWQQDNHYIISGYRPASNSYLASFKSIFHLHNETVNIYTHLLGSLSFLLLSPTLYNILYTRYPYATKEDVYAFSCFFLGAIACLGMSATYHTISNHSHAVAVWGNQLDYAGIVLLIWGSFVPVLYYTFQDRPDLQQKYWAMITTLAAATTLTSTHKSFRTPALRPFRALMFVLMGLSAIFPVLHGIKLFGLQYMRQAAGLDWVVLQGVLYISGAAIYAARVPEKWGPGKYDIWGSSHQIFHVLVVLAAGSHLVGLVKAFDFEMGRRSGMGTDKGGYAGSTWL